MNESSMRRLLLRLAMGAAITTALLPSTSSAQTLEPDFQAWDQIFLEGKVPNALRGRLRLSLDLQVRRMNTPIPYTATPPHEIDHTNPNPQRPNTVVIVRPAIGYAFNDWGSVWLGYAWQPIFYDAADLRPTKNVQEHRLWYQLSGNWNRGRWNVGFRSRMEHRFRSDGPGAAENVPSEPVHGPDNLFTSDTAWAHRFRQQVRIAYTFRTGRPWLLILSDEIFFHFNETNYRTEPGLDQNRAFLGIGYAFGASARTEIGYMNQYVHRYAAPGSFDPNQLNHIFAINVIFRFGFEQASAAPAAPPPAQPGSPIEPPR